jgi:hypothetical protein
MTRRTLDLLGSKRKNAYEAALGAIRKDARDWWADMRTRDPDELDGRTSRRQPTLRACAASWRLRCCRGSSPARRNWRTAR